MKRIVTHILGLSLLLIGCNSEQSNDCFQTEGAIIETDFNVEMFSEIRIEGEVSLILKQGDVQEVVIETGENLLSDVQVSVVDDILVIRDENSCNFFREYGITKATVTTPNLTLIRNSSSYDVRSEGVLNFPALTLVSNTTGGIDGVRKGGDFYLNVNCDTFNVSANGQSVFYISGTSENARISFTDENPRFEGSGFIVNELKLLQVGANDMVVNPQQKISGIIRGTGDVISVHRPEIIEVEQFYTGQLIFQD